MSANERIREHLSAYLDGELSEVDAKLVAAALAGDETLAEELRQLRATRALLQGLPRARAPEAFAENLLREAARRGAVRPVRKKTLRVGWGRYAAVAALVLVSVGIGMILSRTMFRQETPRVARYDEPEGLGEPARDIAEEGRGDEKKLVKKTDADAFEEGKGLHIAPKGGRDETIDEMDKKKEVVRRRAGPETSDQPEAGEAITIATLAAANMTAGKTDGSGLDNEIIYTNNSLTVERTNVEKLLAGNGFQIARVAEAVEQKKITPNNAVMLNLNPYWNDTQNQKPADERVEVVYAVYGPAEKVEALREQLNQKVRYHQQVSQVSESVYNRTVSLDGQVAAGWTPAKGAEPPPAVATAPEEEPRSAGAAAGAEPLADQQAESAGAAQAKVHAKPELDPRSLRTPPQQALLITLRYRAAVPLDTTQERLLNDAEAEVLGEEALRTRLMNQARMKTNAAQPEETKN